MATSVAGKRPRAPSTCSICKKQRHTARNCPDKGIADVLENERRAEAGPSGRRPSTTLRVVSITAVSVRKDVTGDDVRNLEVWIAGEAVERAFFSTERGGNCSNLHFQGVALVMATSDIAIGNMLRSALKWSGNAHRISVKSLSGTWGGAAKMCFWCWVGARFFPVPGFQLTDTTL